MLAIVLAVLARPLLGLVYGDDFRDAAEPAAADLLPGAVLFAGSSILGAGIYAAGRPFTATVTQVLGMIVTVVGLFVFLRTGGITAAALVSTASYATRVLRGAGRLPANHPRALARVRAHARRACERLRANAPAS